MDTTATYFIMNPMRKIFLVGALLCFVVAPASADQTDPRLEPLFNRLAAVRTLPDAEPLIAQIDAIWQSSGSDTVDLLMARAFTATQGEDFDTAMKLLDVVAEMKPLNSEIWYRRAGLLLLMDSQQEAAVDLARAIRLEPRHFRALALIARLADLAGNKPAAIAAYKKAASINPMLEAASRRATELLRKPPA